MEEKLHALSPINTHNACTLFYFLKYCKLINVQIPKKMAVSYNEQILINEIYKGWSGMKASEYKKYKRIRKESLRDNMTDIEVALTNIGEIATRDITVSEKPQGLKENLKVAKRGEGVAKVARDLYEKETKKSAVSKSNSLNYKYKNELKEIESKVGGRNE